MVSRSSHLFHESKHRTSNSCCFHRQVLLCNQHAHHYFLHLRVHHSPLHLHRKDPLGYNIFFLRSFFHCIFGPLVDPVVFLELFQNFAPQFSQWVSHSSHPFHGSKDQTVGSCCFHKQDPLCIHYCHRDLLHLQVHHSRLLLHRKDFLGYNIVDRQNCVPGISDLVGDLQALDLHL